MFANLGKKDIYSLTPSAAAQLLEDNGFKATQADNIFRDIYAGGAESFDDMKLTSKKIVSFLKHEFYFGEIVPRKSCVSEDAEMKYSIKTIKFLFELSDGCKVETVYMEQPYANCVCVSTQSGCNMGCKFCCSGKIRKLRDLTAGEMVEQLIFIRRELGVQIKNVDIMGIGEPLDNYDNLTDFMDILSSPFGFALGSSHITVSTCGIAPKIDELAQRESPCNLAVSIHAAYEDLRNWLMPINLRYPLADVIPAAVRYSKASKRKVMLEYTMINGVNDSESCASQLAQLIEDEDMFVNLIPYNESADNDFRRSSGEQTMRFYDVLKKNGVGVTMRREVGGSLNAGCGQLRSDKRKISLRRYNSADLDELVSLFCGSVRNVCRNDYTPEQLDAWADAPDFSEWDKDFSEKYTLVARFDGKIAGFGNIDKSGVLDMLYVHRDFQRLGIAAEICTALEKYPNADEITVHASKTARGFFEHRGYITVEEKRVRRRNKLLTNYTMTKRTVR